MTFLNPGLLWFLAGGSIPVIIHLLYRQRFRVVHWAAMEFLLAAIKRTQRRLRLENLLLLLIRFLILVLLALAVARPLLSQSPLLGVQNQPTHYVFVLDDSYSMAYRAADKSHFDRAKETAAAILNGLPNVSENDRISVVTMSGRAEVVVPMGNSRDSVLQILGEMQPSHAGPGLAATLRRVREQQDRTSRDMVCRIYVFSDFQRAAWTAGSDRETQDVRRELEAISSREDTQVFLIDAAGRDMSNYAVVDVRASDQLATTKDPLDITVELFNYSGQAVRDLPVRLEVRDAGDPPGLVTLPDRTVTLSPGGRATVEFRHQFTSPGPHVVRAFVDPPDYLDVDDQRHLALDVRETVRILAVDGDPGERRLAGEVGFYAIALDPLELGRFTVIPQPRLLFDAGDLTRFDVLLLANVDSLPEDAASAVDQFVRAGGGLWLALGDKVDAAETNRVLYRDGVGVFPGRLDTTFGDGTDQTNIRLSQVRTDHSIFGGRFNDEMFAALREVQFTRAWRLLGGTFPPEAVVASFDDGSSSPAILALEDRARTGDGRVLVTAFPVDRDWNVFFPQRAIYAAFVLEATRWLAHRPEGLRNVLFGDPIVARLPIDRFSPHFALELAEGGSVTLYPTQPAEGDRFFTLSYPSAPEEPAPQGETPETQPEPRRGLERFGVYRLLREEGDPASGGREVLSYFACNPPPARPTAEEILASESNLERIEPDALRQLYPEFRVTLLGDLPSASAAQPLRAEGFGVWKQLLWAVLGLILTESVLAMLFGRRKQ